MTKPQGDPQNANTSGTVRESGYVPAEQPVVASVGPIDAYAVRRAMQEFPAEYQTAGLLVTLKAAIRTYLACVTAAPSATERTCEWEADDDGVYHTDCDNAFTFIDAGPKENKMAFCGYCGGNLRVVDRGSRGA